MLLSQCIFPVQEYKRLETLRQIKEADRRTEEMAARKEEMINQRRRAALEVLSSPGLACYWPGKRTHNKPSSRRTRVLWVFGICESSRQSTKRAGFVSISSVPSVSDACAYYMYVDPFRPRCRRRRSRASWKTRSATRRRLQSSSRR